VAWLTPAGTVQVWEPPVKQNVSVKVAPFATLPGAQVPAAAAGAASTMLTVTAAPASTVLNSPAAPRTAPNLLGRFPNM
jgi:hypothetical protein